MPLHWQCVGGTHGEPHIDPPLSPPPPPKPFLNPFQGFWISAGIKALVAENEFPNTPYNGSFGDGPFYLKTFYDIVEPADWNYWFPYVAVDQLWSQPQVSASTGNDVRSATGTVTPHLPTTTQGNPLFALWETAKAGEKLICTRGGGGMRSWPWTLRSMRVGPSDHRTRGTVLPLRTRGQVLRSALDRLLPHLLSGALMQGKEIWCAQSLVPIGGDRWVASKQGPL